MFYLGVLGHIGAGKDAFCRLLAEAAIGKTVVSFPASTILKESLDLWALERKRENYERYVEMMLKEWGADAFSNALRARIAPLQGDIIAVTGLRLPTDIPMLRKFTPNLIVYIHADFEKRFARRKMDSEKVGEAFMTEEEFIALDNRPLERNIAEMRKEADDYIQNNSDLATLRAEVGLYYQHFIAPAL